MKKFLVIYHSPAAAMEKMATATPEERAAGMKPWADWMQGMGEGLIDGGSPFMPGTRINKDGSTTPSTNEVTGYSIIEANDQADALAKLKNHPHTQWTEGCAIEFFECVKM
jgi:hypothetical protein